MNTNTSVKKLDILNFKRRGLLFFILLIFLLIVSGCSHQLSLKNANQYVESMPFIDKTIIIGISTSSTQEEETFVNYVVDELINIGNCKLIYPYTYTKEIPVDYIVDLKIKVDYKGSGTNFLISWPGYIVFAPAWNGFIYYANINTDLKITDYHSGDVKVSKRYETRYRCNQAEFDRTFIEISWLEYGIIALIGGLMNMSYDKDITPDFNMALSRPYGSYIARNIGKQLKNL